jgi:hypothetical protein
MRAHFVLRVVFVVAGVACGSSNRLDSQQVALDAARQQWTAQSVTAYSFTWARTCFCYEDVTRPTRIDVLDGQIANAFFVDDGEPVTEATRRLLGTVDTTFDELQGAIDRNASQLRQEFDETRGFPTKVFIDYSERIADDEMAFQLSDLEPATY